MQKKLFVFLVALVWTIALAGQSLTLNKVGIKAAGGGQTIHLGERVIVYLEYTTTEFENDGSVECLGYATTGSNNNQLRLYWWNDDTQDSYVYCNVRSLNRIISENGTFNDTVSFVLPTPPSDQNRIRVKFRIFGDSDGDGNVVYSSVQESGYGSPTGYYQYLNIDRNVAPEARNVSITNPEFAKVGQTLQGSYTYYDADNDTQSGTTFRWLRSDSQTGTYTAITGATNQSYTVVQADLGKYLKFEVTPRASTGISPGTTVLSSPTGQVTGAPVLEFNATYKTIAETSANTGAVSSETYLRIDATNTTFASDITEDYISIQGLPTGLQVSDVQCLETSNIRIYLSGNATYHEYAASVSNVKITVDSLKLVGVSGDKQTTNSASVNFINNPPTGLALDSVGNNYVKITWNNPAGLLASNSGLDYFNILRNEQLIYTYYFDKGTYYYTDNNVTNGTQYRYKVQAVYEAGTPETSAEQKATPLAITAFSFSNPPATGTIDHTNKTIKVAVPNGTDRTALIASFTATGAIVKVGETTQTSGTTANNFTNPVTYILTTNNDASTCSYVVTVNEILATPVTEDGTTTTSSIQAKWGAVSGASSYLLDVSTNSSFSSFLPGYQNKSLTSTSCIVNGLNYNTAYYYRVKAVASDPDLNSNYSTTKEVTTENVAAGEGSTEINSSEETTINVGNYDSGHGTITPTVKVDPTAFSPSENNLITVSMSYGATPEGLQYNLAFDNASIGIGTFVLSYIGLGYDPTDVGYRLNGGVLHSVGGDGINTSDKTVTFEMSSLSKGSKAVYELQIVLNDESGQTLPVVLTSFTATLMVQGKVRLDWVTQSETNLSGFRVLRNTVTEVSTAIAVSSLIAAANTSSTVVYSFIDSEVPGNGIYYYWLQIEDLDGGISYSAALTVQVTNGENPDIVIPKITALLDPFPNPFNPSVTIPFDLAVDGRVTLKIYNLKGQLIRDLLDENRPAASHRVLWDGKDNKMHNVSTGTYIILMNAPNYRSSHKISLLK
ncbi:MAG: hypothetical protein M0R67_00175 [Candidatus Cloacimonas sp.]|nr:hypothetical protein [Candidatus Cloacimonas sp.]